MRVATVGVVGAGTMGAAIAELFAFNGLSVRLTDTDPAALARGVTRVGALVDELVAFHRERAEKELNRIAALGVTLHEEQAGAVRRTLAPKVTAEQGTAIRDRVRPVATIDDLDGVDLVVEAVFETYAVKREVLGRLDEILPEGRPIATNTSSLSLSRLSKGLRHRHDMAVVHFFNPPGTLPLVEVAGGLETREEVLLELVEFLTGLRNHRAPLVPIRVAESPAFVVNRILLPVLNEACFVLGEGIASARDIDLAMKAGAGLPMGPFELADLIGLDVTLEVAETLARETGDPKYRPSGELRRRVAAGHLGRKSGRGFYEYPAG